MRCHALTAAAAAGALALVVSGGAQAQGLTLEERVAQVDEYLTRMHAFGAFDGAMLIAKGEDVLLAKGWGDADKESHRPWTADTVSTVGSITKQFTGAAVVLLNQEGKLEFTDTIGEFFPGAPADKAGITVHQLLTHSAGFPGAIGEDEDYINRDDFLALAWETPLLFAPGTRYEYSNTGYSVAAAIVEKVSGQRYEAFVRERLFLPAGMHDTGYLAPGFSAERLATGYRNGERWGTVMERQSHDEFSWHLMGNGGIHSTARDMHKWWLSIRGNTVLDPAHTEVYLAPHMPEDGRDTFYGYGWVNFEAPNGERYLSHNGGNGFFFADCAFFPESDLFVFGMVNDARGTGAESTAIFRFLGGGELSMPPDPATVDIEAINAIACERAQAWVAALNAGPDAMVQYGVEHRIDEGKDASLNEGRRRSTVDFAEQWGALRVRHCAATRPGQALLTAAGEKGHTVRVRVTVSAEAPHRVTSITLGIDDPPVAGGGGGAEESAEDVLQRAADLADSGQVKEATALMRELTAREPENGRAWFQLGYFLLLSGANDDAVAPFERTLALGFQPATSNYNLACAHAKEGRTEAALDALEAAVAAGYDNVHGMHTDPDLKSIRETARFKEIAAKAGAGS